MTDPQTCPAEHAGIAWETYETTFQKMNSHERQVMIHAIACFSFLSWPHKPAGTKDLAKSIRENMNTDTPQMRETLAVLDRYPNIAFEAERPTVEQTPIAHAKIDPTR